MKLLKKALACLLAVSMIIPSNLTTVLAAPEDDSGKYTVTIEDTDYGNIVFDGSDKKLAQYNPNDTVSIKMLPDDNFEVSEFTIKDAETDEVIVDQETTDDEFSFPMPDYDIVVSGEFKKINETLSSKTTEYQPTQILVGTDDETIIRKKDELVSSYDGLYLINFNSYEEAVKAVEYYSSIAEFAELNEVFEVAEDEISSEEVIESLENDDDALSTLNEVISDDIDGAGTIALIDTGVNGDVYESISLIGDDASDDNGHGTRMYEIIKEEYPEAKVISIKVMNADGKGQASDIYAAIEYAIEKKVSIINLSLSAYATANNAIIEEEINKAVEAGITVVGAAGNKSMDVKDFIPGRIANAIIVGAINSSGNPLTNSNFGSTLDYYTYGNSSSEATARLTGIIARIGIDKLAECSDVKANRYNNTDDSAGPSDASPSDASLELLEYKDWGWDDVTWEVPEYFKNGEFEISYTNSNGGTVIYPDSITCNVSIVSYNGTPISSWAGYKKPITVMTSGGSETYTKGTYLYHNISIVGASGGNALSSYNRTFSEAFCTNGYNNHNPAIGTTATVTLYIDPSATNASQAVYSAGGFYMDSRHGLQHVGFRVGLNTSAFPNFTVRKRSTDGSHASFEGIEYTLYCGEGVTAEGEKIVTYARPLARFTLGESGDAESVDIITPNTTITEQDAFNLSASSDDPGWIVYTRYGGAGTAASGNVFEGMMYLKETKTNANYEMNDTIYWIPEILKGGTYTFEVEDSPIFLGVIQIMKVDQNGNGVGGATYGLYNTSGQLIQTVETASTGLATIPYVEEGNYVVKEVSAPTGYTLDTNSYNVTIDVSETISDFRASYWDSSYYTNRDVNIEYDGHVVSERELIYLMYDGSVPIFDASGNRVANAEEIVNNSMKSRLQHAIFSGFNEVGPNGASNRSHTPTFQAYSYVNNYGDLQSSFADPSMQGDGTYNYNPGYNYTSAARHYSMYGALENRMTLSKEEYAALGVGTVTGNSTGLVIVKSKDDKTNFVKVKKQTISSCSANVAGNPNYSLAGARFKIYKDAACTQPVTNNAYDFQTNASGDTTAINVSSAMTGDSANFYIKEVKASKGYLLYKYPVEVTVTKSNTEDNPAIATINETPKGDPVNLQLRKSDKVDESISGATFKISYYALDTSSYNSYSSLAGQTPTRVWYFKTDSNGRFSANTSQAQSGSSAFYTNSSGAREYPAGIYTLEETEAGTGYYNKGTMQFASDSNSKINFENGNNKLFFKVVMVDDGNNGYDSRIVDANGVNVLLVSAENQIMVVETNPKYFGFKFTKRDADLDANEEQGNTPNLTTTVKVINRSGKKITIDGNPDVGYEDGAEVFRFTTDSNGNYTSTNNKLQVGTYEFIEVTPPTGYNASEIRGGKINFTFPSSTTTPSSIDNLQDKQIYDVTNQTDAIKDPIKRGGFAIEKIDSDKNRSEQSGDAPNITATFAVYNRSSKAVIVDVNGDGVRNKNTESFAPDTIIFTFNSDYITINNKKYFSYISPMNFLPYGSYEIVEVTGPEGYLTSGGNGVYRQPFTISDESQVNIMGQSDFISNVKSHLGSSYSYREYETPLVNEPVKGTFALEKWDADIDDNIPQGNSKSLKAKFQLINNSNYSVVVDVNGDGISNPATETFANGAVIFEFETDDNGRYINQTQRLLPYGSYIIKEIGGATGYLNSTTRGGRIQVPFTIRKDKELYVIGSDDFKTAAQQVHSSSVVTHEKNTTIEDPVKRGGFAVEKLDSDKNISEESGDALNVTATFAIYNRSEDYVVVDTNGDGARNKTNERYEKNALIMTFKTEKTTINGKSYYAYISSTDLLPYGTYEIIEQTAPTGYLSSGGNGIYKTKFTIDEEEQFHIVGQSDFISNVESQVGNTVSYVEHEEPESILTNEPYKGTFAIEKWDADDDTDDPQGDSGSLKARFQIINSSVTSVVVDVNGDGYSNPETETFAKNDVIFEFETDDEGRYINQTERLLPYGTYTIKEISPANGYLNSTIRGGRTEITFTIRSDKEVFVSGSPEFKDIVKVVYPTQPMTFRETEPIEDPIKRGKVTIKKNDSERKEHENDKSGYPFSNDYDSKYAQGDATFEGAVYEIFNTSDNYVWVDTNGDGTYQATEKYAANDTRPVYTLVTDVDGYAETPDNCLPYGSYKIVEKTAPEGYLITTDRGGVIEQDFEIREESEEIFFVYDKDNLEGTFYDAIIRGGFEFDKRDEETGKPIALGSANLQGTYNVINRSGSYVWVDTNENNVFEDEEFYAPNDVVFTFKTDADTGYYKSSDMLLPYGTYEIVEIDPPEGYLMLSDRNPDLNLTFSVREHKKIYDETNKIFNYVVRGNLHFDKRCDDDAKVMAYIPFKITALDKDGNEIESHIVYTDQNGIFDSSNDYALHSYKTNIGDEAYANYIAYYEEHGVYPDEDTWPDASIEGTTGYAGTWFGVDTTPVDDLRLDRTGAFPYGTYKIEELPCKANQGYNMYNDYFTISYDASERTIEIDPHGYQNGYRAGDFDFGTIQLHLCRI